MLHAFLALSEIRIETQSLFKMLLSKHFISIVVEHLAAPAQQTRVICPLVRLLHYVSGVLVRLVELEGLEHALDFETDEVYRAAALLE